MHEILRFFILWNLLLFYGLISFLEQRNLLKYKKKILNKKWCSIFCWLFFLVTWKSIQLIDFHSLSGHKKWINFRIERKFHFEPSIIWKKYILASNVGIMNRKILFENFYYSQWILKVSMAKLECVPKDHWRLQWFLVYII